MAGSKGESYIDKNGKSWLVWYDKEGEKEWDIWTTPIDYNEPTHKFIDQDSQRVIWVDFEITKFPDGYYGFGWTNNFTDPSFEKVRSQSQRRYENETMCLQHAVEHLTKQRICFLEKYISHVKAFIENLKKEINPQTLF